MVSLTSRPSLDKLNSLLKPPTKAYDKLVELFYDTTFKLGQFYLSTVSYRHYMLEVGPTTPCAFLIHQRKYSEDRISFLKLLKDNCPNLALQEFAFITAREFKDVSSIFPRSHHYFCWNHIKGDVRYWTRNRRHQGVAYQRKDAKSF